MEILLDTHIFLWLVGDTEMLSTRQINAVLDRGNNIFISHYTFMEIAIKQALGKLPDVKRTIAQLAVKAYENGYEILPSRINQFEAYLEVPLFENHRDPFDRFIIATAKYEGMSIMTNDPKFNQYDGFVQLWK